MTKPTKNKKPNRIGNNFSISKSKIINDGVGSGSDECQISDDKMSNKSLLFETISRFDFDLKEVYSFLIETSPNKLLPGTLEIFKIVCLLLFCSTNEDFSIDPSIQYPNLNDFFNHFKIKGKFMEHYSLEKIEILFKDEGLSLYINSNIVKWYFQSRDESFIRFLNIFGEYIPILSMEVIGDVIQELRGYPSDYQIEFTRIVISCNKEFNRRVKDISVSNLAKRIDNQYYTIYHSFKYDCVEEFKLFINRDNGESFGTDFTYYHFWMVFTVFDCKRIRDYYFSVQDNQSKSFLNPPLYYTRLSIYSTYFSHEIMDSTFLSNCQINRDTLKGVLAPTTSTTGSTSFFKVLPEICGFTTTVGWYLNDLKFAGKCIKFISKLTENGIFLNTELAGDNSELFTELVQNEPNRTICSFFFECNCSLDQILVQHSISTKSTTSLVSRVMGFNQSSILLVVLKNLTQGGCTLTRDIIDENCLLQLIHSPNYSSCLITLHNYYNIPPKYNTDQIPFIFFTTNHLTLGFLLSIHGNAMETIDIKDWVQLAISSGLYQSESELFKLYPKLSTICKMPLFSRTLNIFEFQILFGYTESSNFIARDLIKISPQDLAKMNNQELLLLFDFSVMKKKVVRSKESIQAELDLIQDEKNEKELKKQKEKERKLKQKQQQQLQLQQQQQQQNKNIKNSTTNKTASPASPTAPNKTTSQIEKVGKSLENIQITSKAEPTASTTSTTTTTTTTTIIETEIFQIGKFKFSRDESNIIGRGSNGTLVFKGIWSNNKIPVAIKQMQKAFNPLISKEIEVLIRLTSNNCLNMIRYIDQEEDSMFVYLGLTLCQESLQDLIESNRFNQFINDGIAKNTTTTTTTTTCGRKDYRIELFKDIVNGIQFLHSQDIVHNDINTRNILVKDGRFLISDLGLSKMEVETSFAYTHHAPTGQEGYHPAEVLLEKRKTKSVDIFSLGCILYYILTNGRHPFGEKLLRVANIIYDKPDLDQLKFVNPIACDLVSQMISKDISKRPTIESITNHLLFWSGDKKIKFIESFLNQIKNPINNTPKLNKLLNCQGDSNVPFLAKPFNQIIDSILIQHICDKQSQLSQNTGKKVIIYQYDQVRDLVRCIRNTIVHHQEIERILLAQPSTTTVNDVDLRIALDCLNSPESVLNYFELKFPDLLFHLYKYSSMILNQQTKQQNNNKL